MTREIFLAACKLWEHRPNLMPAHLSQHFCKDNHNSCNQKYHSTLYTGYLINAFSNHTLFR